MNGREQWGTRAGFILAAIGSAVGLGNIWRFPYVAYENGGGAFFLPYLFALLTAGIPLLIMEFTIGHKYRGSAPLSYARLNKKAEWIGWWQVAIAFVIATYYAVIIAWALSYTYFAFNQRWGKTQVVSSWENICNALMSLQVEHRGYWGTRSKCLYSISSSMDHYLRSVI